MELFLLIYRDERDDTRAGRLIMRITSSMYYDNIYGKNNKKLSQELFDVNKQIASGLSIEYAHEDVGVFIDTMRLDNEVTTLDQAAKSTESALKMARQTDTSLNDMQDTLDRMKVLMVDAANGTHSDESMDAIAQELNGLRDHLVSISNTSINGKYLFSGSVQDTKPIDDNGVYHGNDQELTAFAGSGTQIPYNIPGSDLFLGEESQTNRKITTNVKNYNQTLLYPDVMQDSAIPRDQGVEEFITTEDSIRDLMGDTDTDATNNPNPYHFYINGTKHNGESFSEEISMDAGQSVGELLDSIAELYGKDTVNVTLNEHGQIEIEDKISGSSKLDFQMVGAVDFNLDGNDIDDAAGATSIEELESKDITLKGFTRSEFGGKTSTVRSVQSNIDPNSFAISGEYIKKPELTKADGVTLLKDVFSSDTDHLDLTGTDVNGNAVNTTFTITDTTTMQDLVDTLDNTYDGANDNLNFYIKDGKILFESNDDTATSNIDIQMDSRNENDTAVSGFDTDTFLSYDKINFVKTGDTVSSNVSQIVKSDNSYAVDATKLSDVADLSQINSGTLDGTTYTLEGFNIDGVKYSTTIDLKSSAKGGTTFKFVKDDDGNGDLSNNTVTTYTMYNVDGTEVDADAMTYRQLMDVVNMATTDNLPATNNSSDDYFTAISTANTEGNVTLDSKGRIEFKELNTTSTAAEMRLYDANSPATLTFQANDALVISDPKTDFFAQIDEAINSIELKRYRADGDDLDDPRNLGIQNAIQAIDDLSVHVSKEHSKIGAMSNRLDNSTQRNQLLSINTQSLRSSVVDTDIAEASLRLTQLDTNYQAMLSTVGKVSKLSLVNYL